MKEANLIPHLFRKEFSKMVAVLCKTYGLSNIQLAEDIVGETFLLATETWGLKGIPDNPSAWLYKVAKNKTLDHFKRNKVFREKIAPKLHNGIDKYELEVNLSDKNIIDSQLQMIFAVCNPIISPEAQITLALRVLCGFGINEISKAFLSNKETINKRLHRAKETLRKHKVDLSFPSTSQLDSRIDAVLSTIYLLFNEGYYSVASKQTIKKELCIEAMRLTYMLLDNQSTNLPKTNALMALLCFQSSRFEARTNNQGELVLYLDQDTEQWDYELIKKGTYYLNKSAQGNLTKYHLEAGISFWHTRKEETAIKWDNILQLYNLLLQIEYSPIVALNRTYALSKVKGTEAAITEALKIKLNDNHLYHSLLAELYKESNKNLCLKHLELALALVKTEAEKMLITKKIKNTIAGK